MSIKKKPTKYWCTEDEWNNISISPDDIQGSEEEVWYVKMLHRLWHGEQSVSLSPMEGVTRFIRAEAKRTYKPKPIPIEKENTRRSFLKKALVIIAAATIVTPELIRAIEHVKKYHPEVQAVIDRMPGDITIEQRKAMADFILSEMENGNWDLIESFQFFGFEDEKNAGINWKGK